MPGARTSRTERRTVDPRSFRPGRGALAASVVALCVASGLLFSACLGRGPEAPRSPTAAVVEGRTITVDEIDEAIEQRLFEDRFPAERETALYTARRETLDQLIDQEVLAKAASGSGLAPDAWLAAEVERRAPVTDEEIDAFWAEHEARIPKDRPEEQLREEIRAYLAAEHGKTLLAELRGQSQVRVVLARPRHPVEIRGTPRGPEDAPVTIVEFSDFQCPFCLRASGIIQEVLARYPQQVRFYYRHLPLPNHPRAWSAAIASECAGRQGRFWAYHDQLFADTGAMEDADLRARAEALELDLAAFEACLTSPEVEASIEEDLAAAEALGVSGTPVFFVNGIRLTGAQPVENFTQVIEQELGDASPQE